MFKKYKPLIYSFAKKYLPLCKNKGIEYNDLVQEGMIGLSYAINSYKDNKNTLFFTYASTCIERKILSSLKGSNRLKNKILNESVSFDNNIDSNFDFVLKDNKINPENILLEFERTSELNDIINDNLTDFEKKVLTYKMSGFLYKEIAEKLNCDKKAVDNAIQRLRSKLKNKIT